MESHENSDKLNENQKNAVKIRCQFCKSLVLNNNVGTYTESEFSLPLMHQKHSKSIDELETENFKEYWIIEDMFHFENIGFSNTIGNYKYLICADCEMGPIGYHDLSTKRNYVALQRVKHEN